MHGWPAPWDFDDVEKSREVRVWFPMAPFKSLTVTDPQGFVSTDNIKVSIDFDDTITAYPEVFSKLTEKIKRGGGKIYILTGRPKQDKEDIENYLEENDITYDKLETYPEDYSEEEIDSILDVLIGQFKAKRIKDIGIDLHIDDKAIHIKQIKKTNPDLLILKPWLDRESSFLALKPILVKKEQQWIKS